MRFASIKTKFSSSKFLLVMGFSFDKIRTAIYEDLIFYTNNVGHMTKSKNYYTNHFII